MHYFRRSLILKNQKCRKPIKKSFHPQFRSENENKYGRFSQLFEDSLTPVQKYVDTYNKHRNLVSFEYHIHDKMKTEVGGNTFIAPDATLIGNVEVYDNASVWYGVVIKGDVNMVRIGFSTNIQDNTVISEAFEPLHSDHDGSTIIGHHCTIGHGCVLRACTIEDNCLIGINCVLPEGSYVETESQLAAGSVLQRDQRIPSGQLWGGNPAKFIRDLTDEEKEKIELLAKDYYRVAKVHLDEFYLDNDAYRDAEKQGVKVGFERGFPWD